MVRFVLQERQIGGAMLKLNVENIGDLAIVECEGRIVRSESVSREPKSQVLARLKGIGSVIDSARATFFLRRAGMRLVLIERSSLLK